MNNKDLIIDKTIEMIEKNPEGLKNLTIREIARQCNIAIGLVNYHFSSKDELINVAVNKIINGIVEKFGAIRDEIENLSPVDKLVFLGDMTFDYLFDHYQISKISILSDIDNPSENNNTERTFQAYVPIIKNIRPELSDFDVKTLAFQLVIVMQQSFVRHDIILRQFGVDLTDKEQRHKYHRDMIKSIIGV